jgi:hypothetical protein
MGFSVPTGDDGNSAGHTIYTPTIAFGKGFGNFDVQSTVGIAIPNGGVDRLSMPLAWNTAFQYRIFRYFWPELEFNYTWFTLGENTGKNQLFITPGLLYRTHSDPRPHRDNLRRRLPGRRNASSRLQQRGDCHGAHPLLGLPQERR